VLSCFNRKFDKEFDKEFNKARLIASSQNFDIEYSSRVTMLISSIDSNFRLDSSRYDLLLLISI